MRCACGAEFVDKSGQVAAFQRLVGEGKLALVIGCGKCGELFVPSVGVAETLILPAARYRVVKELGFGGMSLAMLAIDTATGEQVCVKRLLRPADVRPLMQERSAMARLDHPSIVRLRDVYEDDDGVANLVMDFVDGVGLDRVIVRGALPELAAVDIARQLAEAIAHAHAREVVHRDLKPGNVMLERRGARVVPRVLDFGLAVVEQLDAYAVKTAAGVIAGTPLYMAPEQMRGLEITAPADVYAIGVTLAEMVAGTHPFAGSLDRIVLTKREAEGVELEVGSERLRRLVWEMSRNEREQRITAAEAAERLAALLPAIGEREAYAPLNLDVARDAEVWFGGETIVAEVSTDYAIARGTAGVLELRAPAADTAERFGTAMQRVAARGLAGRRVRLAAELATDSAGMAGLWLRADGERGEQLRFDNMADRGLRGTVGWTACAVEMEMPAGTAWVNFGVLLVGRGQVRARGISLTVDGTAMGLV